MSFGASRRCCRSLREPAKAMITGLPRLELSLPVAWLDPYGRRRHVNQWRRILLPDSSGSGNPTGIPCARALGAKVLCLRPGYRAARALCPCLSSFCSVLYSSHYKYRNLPQPQNCWFKPTRQGHPAAHSVLVVFRNARFRLGAFFFWLGLPDSSGRGFCAGFSRLSGKRWSAAGVVQTNTRG
jgi:hypothetical protein